MFNNSDLNNLYFILIYFLYYHASLIILSISLLLNSCKNNTKYKIFLLTFSLLLLSGLPPIPTFFIKCNLLILISKISGKYVTTLILMFFVYYWSIILNVILKFFNFDLQNKICKTYKKINYIYLYLYLFIIIFSFFFLIDLFIII